MNTVKNIFTALLILAISSGIFYLIVMYDNSNDQAGLDALLQEFGQGIVSMIPQGEQRDALVQKFEDFKAKVLNEEVSDEQFIKTIARGTNMQLAEEKPSPEEIEAFIESASNPQRDKNSGHTLSEIKHERRAHQLRDILMMKNEINKLDDTALSKAFSQHIMVTADSDLQILFDSNIHNNQFFVTNPHAKEFIANLPKTDFVKFVKFDESPGFIEQALKDYAPFLPQNLRAPLITNPTSGVDAAALLDSVNKHIQSGLFKTDSIQVIIENATKFMEAWQPSD